jgi:methionine-rich copper-binding protein CopC
MGYAPEDVTTVNAVELAIKYGILTANEATLFANDYYLIRDEAVVILYGAFMNGVNADGTKLIDAYIASGATTAAAAAEAGFVTANAIAMTVKATSADTIEVKFNNPVDKEVVKISVKKGVNNVSTETPAWSEGNKVATIKTNAKLTKGTYTVTATIAEDVEVSATFEVIDQAAATIEILGNVALTGYSDPDAESKILDEAYVYYDVYDQYGNSIRSSTTIQWSGSVNIEPNKSTGLLKLTRSDNNAFTYNEKIFISGVHAKTGTTVTAEVTVGTTQALDSVKVEGFVKKGTTEILKELPAGFKADTYYMIYSANDQNGNPLVKAIGEPIKDNQITFICYDVLLIEKLSEGETTLVIDGVEYYAVFVTPGMQVSKGGVATIGAIANNTGNSDSFNVAIGEDQALASFEMLEPSGRIVDGGSIEIPFKAFDQNGKEITKFVTLAKQTELNKLTFSASPGTLTLSENDDGTATLKYEDYIKDGWANPQTTDGLERFATLTSILTGGAPSNVMLYIEDMPRPTGIKSVDMPEVLVEEDSTTLKFMALNDGERESNFVFVDQYGNEMSTGDANAFFAAAKDNKLNGNDFSEYKYGIRVEFRGQDDYLKFTPALNKEGVNVISYGGSLEISAKGSEDVQTAMTGFSFKFDLVKTKDNKEYEQVSPYKNTSLTIVDISALSSFAVGEFNKFHVETELTGLATGQLGGLIIEAEELVKGEGGVATPTLSRINKGYQQEASVSGKYNGKDVNIPSVYYDVSSDKLVFSGGKATATSAAAISWKATATSADAISWSDFYDVKTANFLRKDADDTVKVIIRAGINKTDETIETLSKGIKIADEAPSIDSLTAKEAITLSPTQTTIKINVETLKKDDVADLQAKDQYGVDFEISKARIKVSSIVPNADGYAENNFKVSNNDSEKEVEIVGAERGDTFLLTVSVAGKSVEIKVTVGADANANITGSTNNYLDKLVNDLAGAETDEGARGLEYQRQIGLQ